MEVVFAYITTASKAQAETIGRALVENRLAACANIIDGMESIYEWQGKIESAKETILIAKTVRAVADELVRFVRERHSYECPCIVFLPVVAGNPAYLRWLEGGVAV